MATVPGETKRLPTLRDLRTPITARIRSKPTTEGQEYLDLWTLKRERARWSHTKERAEQMIRTIDRALKKINLPDVALSANAPDDLRAAKTIDFKAAAGQNTGT